jgi:hypothetical protein
METHALPGARFVDPKVLARIKDLELLARNVVDGFINGLHRAPFFGASVDFAEHRGYVARFFWPRGKFGGIPGTAAGQMVCPGR